MDVTDDGLELEIRHLSICVFLPLNGMCFFFFLKKGFLHFRERLAFHLIVQFVVFRLKHEALSTDIVNTQIEIHECYTVTDRYLQVDKSLPL